MQFPVLTEASLGDEPITPFRRWFAEAQASDAQEPAAMALATLTEAGGPAVRFVLCRGIDDRGVCFFTNRESDKGRQLAASPSAAAALHWQPMHRQVRLSGPVERLSTSESELYFAGRPRGSRITAWASPQSRVVPSRARLEARRSAAEERFGTEGEVPLPLFWGGYRILWDTVEFWQGQQDRLHDRVRFRREGTGWVRERLAP